MPFSSQTYSELLVMFLQFTVIDLLNTKDNDMTKDQCLRRELSYQFSMLAIRINMELRITVDNYVLCSQYASNLN